MRLTQLSYLFLSYLTLIHALALPTYLQDFAHSSRDLFKRKGGGGGGGGGRGGSSSSSSGSSSGGSSSSSSSGSRGGSGSSSGSSGSSSSSSSGTRGGSGSTGTTTTTTNSRGPPRSFGAGGSSGSGFYGGGASTPYLSGARRSGLGAPLLFGAGALAFFPGLWLYGAYAYNYPHAYTYHNDTSNANETHPITCLCAEYQQCGCDENNSTEYLNSVANNGTVAKLVDVNGTRTLVINGTLPNDTQAGTTTTVAGDDGGVSGAGRVVVEMSGYWVVVAGVIYTVMAF